MASAVHVVRVVRAEVQRVAEEIFVAAGVPRLEAGVIVRSLVAAERRGKGGQGLSRIPTYLESLAEGSVRPATDIRVIYETPTTLVLDANLGWGHVIGRHAMSRSVEKAASNGVCISAVRRSTHFGAAGLYAEIAAARGMIGVVASSGPWSRGLVAPWRGRKPLFDTNPIAVAIPTLDEPMFILDMATSQVSRGRIAEAADAGQTIPPTWATGPDGAPTTDARDALSGSLLPLGGYKGFGLGMAVDLLCGALGGGRYPDPDASSHLFCAIDPGHFGLAGTLPATVDAAVKAVKQQPAADPAVPIRVAGDSYPARDADSREWLQIATSTYDRLIEVAQVYAPVSVSRLDAARA